MTYRTDETDEITDQVRNEVSLLVLTCYRPYDSRPFDRLRDLPYGVRLLVLAAKVSGIGVLWVRDGATDYGTTSLSFRVAFQRW